MGMTPIGRPSRRSAEWNPRPVSTVSSSHSDASGSNVAIFASGLTISISLVVMMTGRVKIEKDSGSATCEKAIYYHDGDKIVLTGDPVAWDKGTRVSGKQITMFLAEDRSVVEGGSHVRIEPDGGATK